MKITKISPLSGKEYTFDIPITPEQLAAHKAGAALEKVCKRLTKGERHFIRTGIPPEESEEMEEKIHNNPHGFNAPQR